MTVEGAGICGVAGLSANSCSQSRKKNASDGLSTLNARAPARSTHHCFDLAR